MKQEGESQKRKGQGEEEFEVVGERKMEEGGGERGREGSR